MFKTILMLALLICRLSVPVCAHEKELWRRVYTGEDSVIDMDAASLRFDSGHLLRVRFRTILSKAESLNRSSETKYKSRLETVEFKLASNQYRYREMNLLDAAGKIVWSDEPSPTQEWRTFKEGGMMKRLFDSVRQVPPFGSWKVIDYRFPDGPPDYSEEFRRTLGTRIQIGPDRMAVGTKVCSLPAYQSKSVSDKKFERELGVNMAAVGISANQADTIAVKCESNEWKPPQSLLVKLPQGELLMLWEGVFLVLKNERGQTRRFAPTEIHVNKH